MRAQMMRPDFEKNHCNKMITKHKSDYQCDYLFVKIVRCRVLGCMGRIFFSDLIKMIFLSFALIYTANFNCERGSICI